MIKNCNSFKTESTLTHDGQTYRFHSLPTLEKNGIGPVSRLPYSIRILLENLLRYEDNLAINKDQIQALANWEARAIPEREIFFMPSRVILQDFTRVPAVADLAAMLLAPNAGTDNVLCSVYILVYY